MAFWKWLLTTHALCHDSEFADQKNRSTAVNWCLHRVVASIQHYFNHCLLHLAHNRPIRQCQKGLYCWKRLDCLYSRKLPISGHLILLTVKNTAQTRQNKQPETGSDLDTKNLDLVAGKSGSGQDFGPNLRNRNIPVSGGEWRAALP